MAATAKKPITDYQSFDDKTSNVLDFTRFKLERMMRECSTPKKIAIKAILADYLAKKITVAWEAGKPTYLVVPIVKTPNKK